MVALATLSTNSAKLALKISPDIRAVHVDCGEGSAAFHQQWNRYVEEPTQQAGVATPQLVVLPSRYRLILAPIVEYVLEAERCCPNQQTRAMPSTVRNATLTCGGSLCSSRSSQSRCSGSP